MVLGSVIGSGIFLKPQRIADELGSFEWIIAVWIVAGVLCLLGALSLAELGAMLPRAGGIYVYLREAYGRIVGFLYGWSLFFVVRPAATGSLAAIFPVNLPISELAKFFVSVGVLIFLTFVNVIGVIWGGRMQTWTTAIKAGSLLGIALLPWLTGGFEFDNFGSGLSSGERTVTVTSFMVALLAVMFAYNSWHEVTPLAEEIKDPERNVPLVLIVGVSSLVLLYVGANVAYHSGLSMDEVAANADSATALTSSIIGPVGGTIMMVLVMCSVFGTVNANLMHAPRVYYAMGRDRLFFPQLGILHSVWRTPVVAICCQSSLAIVLIIIAAIREDRGVFDYLTNIVVFGASVFYTMAVFAVIVLRIRRPDLARPYRTLGYPITPLLFVAAYLWFLPIIFDARREESMYGLGILALGIPAYLIWNRKGSTAQSE
jgi:APA family basic amino acid/polyamine antiporter